MNNKYSPVLSGDNKIVINPFLYYPTKKKKILVLTLNESIKNIEIAEIKKIYIKFPSLTLVKIFKDETIRIDKIKKIKMLK